MSDTSADRRKTLPVHCIIFQTKKIAIGMERHSGIVHLVAAMRQGEKLVIWDRLVSHVTEVRTRDELLNYFNSNNVSSVQTWSRQ
ncbi:hypothetical protein [Xanthomonas hydrangeae]|uniref:hypothetical protein n=1 Tax=Xanthomonas hydrangeae TaxID=2775159 RepID=UPI001964D5EC